MALLERFHRIRRLRRSDPERVCGLCGLRFEREPPNCPACGGPIERAA